MKTLIDKIYNINQQIKELSDTKFKLESELISQLDSEEGKTKTYKEEGYKVMVKRSWIYSIDKEAYLSVKEEIPVLVDPVRIKTSFEINPKIMSILEESPEASLMKLMEKFLTKKPAKPYVKIEEFQEEDEND